MDEVFKMGRVKGFLKRLKPMTSPPRGFEAYFWPITGPSAESPATFDILGFAVRLALVIKI
jgi:hypothetical protein